MPGHRAKWLTIYLTLVNENGRAVRINKKGEWAFAPCVADEHGA